MLEGAMGEGSIRLRSPGTKRWEREDRGARPWSTRQGADGKATGHDKGRWGTKRYRWPFMEDNGRVRGNRVTKVT